MKLILVILALSLSAALAAQESPAIPFHLVEGWAMVVDGTIGGIPNRKIMIDTGAVPSAVNTTYLISSKDILKILHCELYRALMH